MTAAAHHVDADAHLVSGSGLLVRLKLALELLSSSDWMRAAPFVDGRGVRAAFDFSVGDAFLLGLYTGYER